MTLINYFEIVRNIIIKKVEGLIEREGITEDEVYKKISDALRHNSKQWSSNNPPDIPYDNPYSRLAYLYHTVPANANLLEFVVERELGDYISSLITSTNTINVCAFGGGPGTEVLGLTKYLDKSIRQGQLITQKLKVRFLLLDYVQEWLESWDAIEQMLDQQCDQITISGKCWSVDITQANAFANIGDIFGQNIYIFSWVLSEIYDDNELDALIDFVSIMADHTPVDSKFIFIDRNELWLKQRVKNIAGAIGLNLGRFQESNRNMSSDEQSSILNPIRKKLNYNPRVTWNAFWVIGTKMESNDIDDIDF